MYLQILISVLLLCLHTVSALPKYLLIPIDEIKSIELRPGFPPQPSLVRVARRAEATVSSVMAPVQTEEDLLVPRIEQTATHVLDYVDFGGHTGRDGAFGWYADFPAHR